MKIVIIGTGYVGLVTGTCFAEMGSDVVCVDIDNEKIELLNQGICPIYEPGLEDLIQKNLKEKRLEFTTDYAYALSSSVICFLTVDTPVSSDGSADMRFIKNAAISIANNLKHETIIVTKSTVPVGTAQMIKETISEALKERKVDIPFEVASNPEFLKEGDAVQDFMKPERVIIGTDSHHVADILRKLYAPFMLSHERLFIMDITSAEITKYAANVMLALRISLMNELAFFCEKVAGNINDIRKAMGADKRIGPLFLYPGLGFGGSCLPKDIRALRAQCEHAGSSSYLLKAIEHVNEEQKMRMGYRIYHYFEAHGGLSQKTLAILGLSFKPNTDDIREAPSLVLIKQLLNEGMNLRLYDPIAMKNAKKSIPDHPAITWCQNEEDAANNAHGIVLATEWKQFRLLDFDKIKKKMLNPVIFDGRCQYDPHEMTKKGFDYIGIGHPTYHAKKNHETSQEHISL